VPRKSIFPEPLPARTVPHDQVRVYVQGMPTKAPRQQPRSTLIPGIPPEPLAGHELLGPEQPTVVEPHVVLDRSYVVLDPGITSRPAAFDHVNLPRFREVVATLPWGV